MVAIRPVGQQDASALLELLLTLDDETSFMMLEPGERSRSLEAQQLQVLLAEVCPDGTLLVAEDQARLVGFLEARGGEYRRNRHAVHLAMGVREGWWGQGVGRQLLEEAERWARGQGKHRLELTVMVDNARARRLYATAGFEVEGTRRHSLLVKGQWVDELTMAKLL